MSYRRFSEAIHISGAGSAAGVTGIVAAVASQVVRVYRLILTNGATAGTIQLQDTANNALSQAFNLAIDGQIVLGDTNSSDPWWQSDQVAGRNSGLGIQWNAVTTTAYGWDIWYLQGV